MTAAGLYREPDLSPWEEGRIVDHLISTHRAPNLRA